MVLSSAGMDGAMKGKRKHSRWKEKIEGMYGFDERRKETQEDRSIVKEQRGMND